MKKLNYLPIFVLSIVNILTISCTKQSAPLGTGYTPPPVGQLPGVTEIGSLTDLGPINSETRVMSAAFKVQSFSLNNDEVSLSGTTALVNLNYYVNMDAQIPEGEYLFSNSDSKSPFTFDSAIFSGAVDSNGYSVPDSQIVDGTVVVTQNGDEYLFEFQGSLESGVMFTGSARGALTYTDNAIYTDNTTNTGNMTY
jgi:hypothetical protein